ncbi:bifunctional UDP-N-acetylglucosamine diphosphorylase/glucosamine-1-phosphate N-acetyltransferase GlmU [Rarobacter incanus]|uniref:Bifunctional protein GlmU n=1 Tax=Rarobacter incanus TaxID=153494 RepID=A0A542SQU1_9MICO|nr:bifunctional UDP-N-acetylglucosamine diphosphorylase/glucosamine-1-phosphate N-acetyltransferase GlmU [Rarobacter incanus]TQK76974.1 bifunctional UDP-N-acetylglucosamine pyrophosphorylase/glucosamine-1-phosphate N-acetyltransferase [Rarobacter incanus]
MAQAAPAAVIILAAGAGTRMVSRTPKVLHRIGGRSLLGHAIHAAQGLDPQRIAVVVRHERDAVAQHAIEINPDILIADQDNVPGTGRAVQCGLSTLDAAVKARAVALSGAPLDAEGIVSTTQVCGPVVVIAGDVPLLDAATLGELVAAHKADGNAVTILTTEVADPTGYGRIVRDPATGSVAAIVEEKDATDGQRLIREINSSVYVFDAELLRDALTLVTPHNAQGEFYLTDVVAIAHGRGLPVRAVQSDDPVIVEGVNDREQLAVLGAELNRRILADWMRRGVTVVDPATTWVDVDVELAQDVTLLPGVQLHGASTVGVGATIGPDTTLTDVEIGPDATVIRTHGSLAVIGAGATVGPFAYLRPGTELGERGKIGTFVEVKNGKIGEGTKVPHLSYVGDATIGKHTNIGAGTIFVNYDGVNKHHSTVGDGARTGANNIFIAPVSVGDGAYTAGGTVVRYPVPAGALAVSAGRQRNIDGWVERRRPGTEAADIARQARESEAPQESSTLGRQAREEQARAGSASHPVTPADGTPFGYRIPDAPPTPAFGTPQAQSPNHNSPNKESGDAQ